MGFGQGGVVEGEKRRRGRPLVPDHLLKHPRKVKLRPGQSGLKRGGDGRYQGKLTERQREMIRTGYADRPLRWIARHFGVSKTYVILLRKGLKGNPLVRGDQTELGPVELRGRAAEVEVAMKFLARGVPLLRNTLLALEEARERGYAETSLDEPVEERWNVEVRRSVEAAAARSSPWSDPGKRDTAADRGQERRGSEAGGGGRGGGGGSDAVFLFDRLAEG